MKIKFPLISILRKKWIGAVMVCIAMISYVPAWSQSPQQRALEQRAETVLQINDDLIRRTIQAYGGTYIHDMNNNKAITMNGKEYRNFELNVIRSRYLIIKTSEGSFCLEIVKPAHPGN